MRGKLSRQSATCHKTGHPCASSQDRVQDTEYKPVADTCRGLGGWGSEKTRPESTVVQTPDTAGGAL